jgi:hypothetical protein
MYVRIDLFKKNSHPQWQSWGWTCSYSLKNGYRRKDKGKGKGNDSSGDSLRTQYSEEHEYATAPVWSDPIDDDDAYGDLDTDEDSDDGSSFNDKVEDKAISYRKKRLALLRHPRPSPSEAYLKRQAKPKDTGDVVGSADFYFSVLGQDKTEVWKRVKITGWRVKPSDPIFAGHLGVFALACPNYQGLNNGCRGHAAMIYKDGKWRLHFGWRLSTQSTHGWDAWYLTNTRVRLEEMLHKFDKGDIIFKFVYVWGLLDAHDPAYLNTTDGCLNAGIWPTAIWLPPPPKNYPTTSKAQSEETNEETNDDDGTKKPAAKTSKKKKKGEETAMDKRDTRFGSRLAQLNRFVRFSC